MATARMAATGEEVRHPDGSTRKLDEHGRMIPADRREAMRWAKGQRRLAGDLRADAAYMERRARELRRGADAAERRADELDAWQGGGAS